MHSFVSLLLLFSIGFSYESIPKCWLTLSDIHRLQHPSSSEKNLSILTFSDWLHDPECEPNELLTKQCNRTDFCWCVDQCEELLVTNWIRVEIKHKVTNVSIERSELQNIIQEHYFMDPELNDSIEIKYDVDSRLITMDSQKNSDDKIQDLSGLAFYMKKDVRVYRLKMQQNQMKSEVEKDELEIESILVYYVDEKRTTNTTHKLTTATLTVTAMLILGLYVGLLFLFLIRRNKRAKYEMAQTSEKEEI